MYSSSFWHRRSRFFHPSHLHPVWAACGAGPRASWQDAETGTGAVFSEHRGFGSGFGVPRPLRFLAMRLELDAGQTAEVAKIIERVKIERAQSAVDLRRASSEIAETLEAGDFDRDRARKIRDLRLEASRRVHDALAQAIEDLYRVLDDEQRKRLATLIRSGALEL